MSFWFLVSGFRFPVSSPVVLKPETRNWKLLQDTFLRVFVFPQSKENRRAQLHAAFRAFVGPFRELDFRHQFRLHPVHGSQRFHAVGKGLRFVSRFLSTCQISFSMA